MSVIPKAGGFSLADSVPLSDAEDERLRAIEADIQPNLSAFVRVGQALAEIKRLRLYRGDGRRRFDQYCQIKWSLSAGHAYRLISDAETAALVSPNGREKPPNERVARELTSLRKSHPELVVPVYDAVSKNRARSTASEFHAAVKAVQALGSAPTVDDAVRVAKATLQAPRRIVLADSVERRQQEHQRQAAQRVLEALRTLSRAGQPEDHRAAMTGSEHFEVARLAITVRDWLDAFALAAVVPIDTPAGMVDEVFHP